MAADVSTILQVLNVLILPALFFVVRIDKRVERIDTLQGRDGRQLEQLASTARDLDIRMTKLECK
jgi:hypothetical protein